MNPKAMLRLGLIGLATLGCWQVWRTPIWGQIEEMEHHATNFDNIVYDKMSTRVVPYHYCAGFP